MLFGTSIWAKTQIFEKESNLRLLTSKSLRSMITKTIGKLNKLNVKGDDGEGVSYQSIDHMWATELNPAIAKIEEELKGEKQPRIGTKQDWYTGSVKYWNE